MPKTDKTTESKPKPKTKEELKAEEFESKMALWQDIFGQIMAEDSWLSGVKKVTTSKKAVVALSGIVATVASWFGMVSVVDNTSLQAIIATAGLGVIGIITGFYLHSQKVSDGPEGKETEVAKLKAELKRDLLDKLPTK